MSNVTIKINGIPAVVPEGSRLIDMIRREGIAVPSLCYMPGMDHYTSCMVCMVRDNDTGRYIPSCSVRVRDGMDIDASGPEVLAMRAESVRLLLVEHRAECEAPCRLVCPYKLDIPLMNRLLTAGRTDEATALAFKVLIDPVAVCTACKGYCDNACRRKKIDTNISIKNTIIYLGGSWDKGSGTGPQASSRPEGVTGDKLSWTEDQGSGTRSQAEGDLTRSNSEGKPESGSGFGKKFNSTLGSVTDDEWQEWVREARPTAVHHTNPASLAEASEEASRCLHCDCRAATDCQLRDVANDLGVKNPRGKHTAHPISKKINPVNGLIFEHAKCIKCGLCVRLGATLTGQPTLTFRGRGYETIITEPLYHDFADILNDAAGLFAEICPTGALALKEEKR